MIDNPKHIQNASFDIPKKNFDGRTMARKTVGPDKIIAPDTDSVDTPQLKANSVTTAKIAASAVTTAKIADANVTLAKLAAGITPSHVVKYAGTVTWTGSGTTCAPAVSGVVAGDIVMATIRVKPTEAAYLVSVIPSTDTLTFTLSAANTSNDAQISYTVFRAAS